MFESFYEIQGEATRYFVYYSINQLIEVGNHTSGLRELVDSLHREVDIFMSEAPSYFMRAFKFFEHKNFIIAAEKSHCEFHYNGVDLLVGKETVDGHKMLMVIGNKMHEVGTLHDDHFPESLKKACPSPEETAYACFLNYPGFERTCFNTEARGFFIENLFFNRNVNQIEHAFLYVSGGFVIMFNKIKLP